MTTTVTKQTEEGEPEPATHMGRQIKAIRVQLGSVDQMLSYDRLAALIAKRADVSISGSALRGYQVAEDAPWLFKVVEALAKIDPREYTPGQIVGWEELPGSGVGRPQRTDGDPPFRGGAGTRDAPTKGPPGDDDHRKRRGA